MMTDEMLVKAAEEANRALLESLPGKEACPHVFSDLFEKKMQKVIRRANHPNRYPMMKKVAVILLIAVLGASGFFAVNTEAREKLFGWIKEEFLSLTSYRFEDEESSIEHIGEVEIGYIPEGYNEIQRRESELSMSILYEGENGRYLSFTCMKESDTAGLYLTVEDYERVVVQVGKYEADIYISINDEEGNEIVWIDEDKHVLFSVGGFFEQGELVKIAESIKFKKE